MKSFVLTLALAFAVTACGGPLKYKALSSAKAPGADATIVADVKKDQGLTQLEIDVLNLAPPDRVSAGAASYVVWQRRSSDVAWSRLGAVRYDEGDRKGTWTGSVPEIAFDLAISAEKDVSVASPSGDTVFSQRVN